MAEQGSVLKGKVSSVKAFGVFVECKKGMSVLVPGRFVHDDLDSLGKEDDEETKKKAIEHYLPPRSDVFVRIVETKADGKLAGSIRAVDQSSGSLLSSADDASSSRSAKRGFARAASTPETGSIHSATVKELKPFGLIVNLDSGHSGLVHSSQLSDYFHLGKDLTDDEKVEKISGVASQGDRVSVKVLESTTNDNGQVRTKCSIKLVSQSTGEDRDPTGRMQQSRNSSNAHTDDGAGSGAGAGAAAGTVTSSGVVHFAHELADVKQMGGGNYELVPEEEELAAINALPGSEIEPVAPTDPSRETAEPAPIEQKHRRSKRRRRGAEHSLNKKEKRMRKRRKRSRSSLRTGHRDRNASSDAEDEQEESNNEQSYGRGFQRRMRPRAERTGR